MALSEDVNKKNDKQDYNDGKNKSPLADVDDKE